MLRIIIVIVNNGPYGRVLESKRTSHKVKQVKES